MNLKQLVADGAYTVFARMGDENKFKQIEAVQYIKQLAATTETDIENWDIFAVFGTGRGNNLYLDRRELNKRFMEHLKSHETAALHASNEQIDPAIIRLQTEANELIRHELVNRVRQLEQEATRYLRDAVELSRQSAARLANAVERKMSVRALSKNQVDFTGHLKTIQEGGFWKFVKYDNGRLHFHTVHDVILRDRRPSAGVDITVNLGKFSAWYEVRTGYMQVHKHENNIDIGGSQHSEGTIHPHVSGGSICWGAASQTMGNMVVAFDVSGVMQLLANLLSDYCDENPYRTLADFKFEQFIVQAIAMRKAGKKEDEVTKFLKDSGVDEEYIGYFWEDRDPGQGDLF